MKKVIASAVLSIILMLPQIVSAATLNKDGSVTLSKEEVSDYVMSKAAAAESLRRLELMVDELARTSAERDQAIRQLFMLNEMQRKYHAMCS